MGNLKRYDDDGDILFEVYMVRKEVEEENDSMSLSPRLVSGFFGGGDLFLFLAEGQRSSWVTGMGPTRFGSHKSGRPRQGDFSMELAVLRAIREWIWH